jgi:hypothetical protein
LIKNDTGKQYRQKILITRFSSNRGGTMKIIKDKVAKLSFVALLIALTAAMFYAPTASAHGEKSQAAFMRMRTFTGLT